MATYENETLGVAFDLPDAPTVRQQLQYESAILMRDSTDLYLRFWQGGRLLISNWKSELVQDHAALDLDEVTDPQVTRQVVWACNVIAGHMSDLGKTTAPGN